MNAPPKELDIAAIQRQFPALHQEVNGRRLVYLDNAATMQRPLEVIEATERAYTEINANVHRGVHTLSQRATDAFERTRNALAQFIGCDDPACIVWTKGCTEAINLVAHSWGGTVLKEDDVVLLSAMEHHANIVPWQVVAARTGAKVIPIPIDDAGDILLDELEALLRAHPVKLVGVKHICNALGTINPIAEIARMAHEHGALILVDGAQSLAHSPLRVSEVDIDFYAMSAHKTYGPTGLGALYAKRNLLEAMPPYQTGGSMIRSVSWEGSTFADIPDKFEPGTPNIAGVIAFEAALNFLNRCDLKVVRKHEDELVHSVSNLLSEIPGLRMIGTAKERTCLFSFVMESAHAHDIGTILDQHGVAVRTGHHCCMPLMKRMGVPATTRASFAVYNSLEDAKVLVSALTKVNELFG